MNHALGRSQGGFGSKLHIITDGRGIPLTVCLSPGQKHESKFLESVLEAVQLPTSHRGRPRRRPVKLAGDKAYSVPRIRRYLHRRGIRSVIPRKEDEGGRSVRFDFEAYRERNIIERSVGWLKESRRLGTRYEKLAVNYLVMAKLAIMSRYFRHLDLSDRT